MTNPVWTDQRVVLGMQRQLAAKRRALDGGARRLGWKLGLGDAGARQQLGTSGPVIAFLTDAGRVPTGAPVSIDGWDTPRLECEVALHIARTIPANASEAEAISSIGGIGAAFELINPELPIESLDEALAGGLFHRAVVLGQPRPPSGLPLDHAARVSALLDGRETASTMVEAITGKSVELLRSTLHYLAAFGERVEAGDVVITGALIPPLPLASGQRWDMEITGVGAATFKTSLGPATPDPGLH